LSIFFIPFFLINISFCSRGGRGRGGRGAESTVSVADLDKELEAYAKKVFIFALVVFV
jgi:hypothetical protein